MRTIALPPTLLAALLLAQQHQQEERESAARWTETGLVFTTSVGTAIEPRDLSRQFKQILRQAGLPEQTRFHDLRHSCATLLITMGVHARVVMEILGHSQISTTMNIYAHVLPHVQRAAVNELDALFAERAQPEQPTSAPIPPPAESADSGEAS